MTLETQVPRTVITGNGTRGPYSLVDANSQAIRFVSTSHVRLVRYSSTTDEEGTTLVLNTDYTIGGTQDARTFTLTSAQAVLASTERIVADRNQTYVQDLSLSNGGSFGAVALMNRLDKYGEYLQELKAKVDRKIEAAALDSTPSTIPLKANATEGDVLVYDADKNLIPAALSELDISATALGSGWQSILQLPAAGTLDNLSGIRFVSTYAALTALATATGLADNATYCTYARSTEEDGGFGFWRYDSGSSATADGGTILAIDGGGAGRFFRLYEDAVDPRWFGAVTGDTGDSTTALTTALDDFYHTVLPVGVIRHASAIILNNSTAGKLIEGGGSRRSILKATPGTDFTQLAIQTDNVDIRGLTFQGPYIAGSYEPASTSAMILVENANETAAARSGTRLDDLAFYDPLAVGIYVTGGNQGVYDTVIGDVRGYDIRRYGVVLLFKAVYGCKINSIYAEDCGPALTGDDGTDGDAYVLSPSAITAANPPVVTKNSHDVETGDYVFVDEIGGMTELNGNTYVATKINANTFSLNVNASAFTAFTSGGYMTTLRKCSDIQIGRIFARRCGNDLFGPGEAVVGVSGWHNVVIDEIVLEDCGFGDIDDLTTQSGNYGSLWNSGQDGLHRCENVVIKRIVDRRSSNNTIVLAGVKNFTIEHIVAENTWRRSTNPAGTQPVIRLTDDTAGNICENVRILSGRVVKDDANSFVNAFIEDASTGSTIAVNWDAIELPSGVSPLVGAGSTDFTDEFIQQPHARGTIYGLTLSNNVSDATNDIDISTGACMDVTNTWAIKLTAALTKRLDAAWAVGTGNGGLDTGSIANTLYYVWLIKRPDTAVVDALFSTSATSPTMPANYTLKRRIGAIRRVSSAILAFVQRGDRFLLKDPQGFGPTTVGTSRVLFTSIAPPSTTALLRLYGLNSGATVSFIVQPTHETDGAPSAYSSPGMNLRGEVAAQGMAADFEIDLDASSQFAARASAASSSLGGVTYGWVDDRGRTG